MRKISKSTVMIFIIINIFNILCFLITLFNSNKPYFFLTFLTYWANSLYLLGVCICDINLSFLSSEKLEEINTFLRDKYFRISYTFSLTVVVLYWCLVFLGSDFIHQKPGVIQFFFHCYLHGITTIFLTMDLFLYQHEYWDKNFFDFSMISILFIFYTVVIMIQRAITKFSPYAFMTNATNSQLIVSSFIMYVFLIDCYQIFIWLLQLSNKKNINIRTPLLEIEKN